MREEGGEGAYRTRRPKISLENDTSATAPSRFMWFIRVLHGYGSRSRSTSRADILLFLKSPIRQPSQDDAKKGKITKPCYIS